MTLVVGLHCRTSVVIGAEQEEAEGYFTKRHVKKLKLYSDECWALGFAGAGDSVIIDRAEGLLSDWLNHQRDFSHSEIAEAIENVLDVVHTKFIDPDKQCEGVALMVGGVCSEGIFLLKTARRTSHFLNDYGCIGIGKDVPSYLLDRLYDDEDNWTQAANITAFVLNEGKKCSQNCGGESNFLVFQNPPSPRWRDLGSLLGLEIENEHQDLIGQARSSLVANSWRMEGEDDYMDEFFPEGDTPLYRIRKENDGSESYNAARKAEVDRLDSLDV